MEPKMAWPCKIWSITSCSFRDKWYCWSISLAEYQRTGLHKLHCILLIWIVPSLCIPDWECHHCSWIRSRDPEGNLVPPIKQNENSTILVDVKWPQRFRLSTFSLHWEDKSTKYLFSKDWRQQYWFWILWCHLFERFLSICWKCQLYFISQRNWRQRFAWDQISIGQKWPLFANLVCGFISYWTSSALFWSELGYRILFE